MDIQETVLLPIGSSMNAFTMDIHIAFQRENSSSVREQESISWLASPILKEKQHPQMYAELTLLM